MFKFKEIGGQHMKNSISTKMIVIFSFVILLICVIVSYTSYKSSEQLARDSLSDIAQKMADSAVDIIDVEKYEQEITLQAGEEAAYYKELRVQLNDMKESTGLKHLFTMGREQAGGEYRYYYMVDGYPLGSDEASQVGDEEDVSLYPYIPKTFETGETQVEISNTEEYGAMVTTYVPIKSASGDVVGIVGTDLDATTFFSVMESNRNMLIVMTAIILLVSLVVVYAFSTYLTKPLKQLTDNVVKVGEGDLSNVFETSRTDEIGKLTNAFHHMVTDLKQIIHDIHVCSYELVQSSNELVESASDVKSGNEQVDVSMRDLSKGAEHQAEATSNVSHIMERFIVPLEEARDIGIELTHASNDVLRMTDKGTHFMIDYEQQMALIHDGVKTSIEKVEALNAQTTMIANLINMIQDIANQTNLLALNAAIEAARAGEHGKGFAVVSEEVRKLADEVSNSVVSIVQIVDGIQQGSAETVQSLQLNYEHVAEGTSKIQTTKEAFHKITASNVMMQQKVDSISAHLQHIVSESAHINEAVNHIAAVAHESSASVEQNTVFIQQTTSSMDDIVSNSEGVAKLAEKLNESVSHFKVERS